MWAGPQIDRPDIIKQISTNLYVQYLPHGVEVHFNAAGLHIATRNRLGYQTTFAYIGASDTLQSITVPLGPSPTYSFVYRATDGKLDKVVAPPIGTQLRSTTFTHTVSGRISRITDPDGKFVEFGYNVPVYGRRLTWRRNRLGDTTFYKYDAAKRLSETRVDMGGTNPDLITTYVAAEGKGLQGTAAIDTALVFMNINGPRIDVTDVTKFWVDRFGAPRKIKNALNDSTIIARGDARWPALVTRVRAPNGAVQSSKYDDRGHMTSTTDSSTFRDELGGRVYATTRYDWDLAWDAVTRVELPEGEVTEIAYDPANGNRLWQQDGRGLASRVNFTYHSTGAATGLLSTIKPPLSPATALGYDPAGNLSSSTTPRGFTSTFYKDAVGRDTLVLSPIDTLLTVYRRDRTAYDVMDRVITSISSGGGAGIPAETLFVTNAYDAESNLTSVARRSSPDTANIGSITTTWRYDAAARRVAEIAPDGAVDSSVYDLASNLVEQRTRRGNSVRMTYDAQSRLTQRIVPDVAKLDTTALTWHFPRYALQSFADTISFTYDAAGSLLTADNRDARVKRTYCSAPQFAETLFGRYDVLLGEVELWKHFGGEQTASGCLALSSSESRSHG